MQTIKEQCELLNIMLLFYKDFEHSAENLLKLVKRFKVGVTIYRFFKNSYSISVVSLF